MAKVVLLIEDDVDILDIIYYMLSEDGYMVLRSTGEDALSLAQEKVPDLILLDHRLENIWGSDICRALKQDFRTKAIPVIMISAAMRLEQTATAAGADAILHKPFGMEELLDLVAAYTFPPAS